MLKRTKIVATLGPASTSESALLQLVLAGVDVVRLNFSHGYPEEHIERASLIRQIAKKNNKHIAVLGDLQGPKIRITRFQNNKVKLIKGQEFILDSELDPLLGTEKKVGFNYLGLIEDCKIGSILILDDGLMQIEVKNITEKTIVCKVLVDGYLSDNKGINLLGGGISAPALTDKDKKDIQLAAKINVDYLALSFVKSPEDIIKCRELYKQAGGNGYILSKLERAEAIADQENLENIIEESDAIMVARGDLGVEIGDAELVAVQKNIINTARKYRRPVITATQMMESMIKNSSPTRAEVFDVANAVLDGTDATMLSAETATGNNPNAVITAMHRIVSINEKYVQFTQNQSDDMLLDASDETIAVSAMYAANHLNNVKCVVCATKTGQTALWMTRINSQLPVYAFSRFEEACRRMALYRGVYPIKWDVNETNNTQETEKLVIKYLIEMGYKKGDRVIFTFGGHHQPTNTLKILTL